jgi:hypothetical protein
MRWDVFLGKLRVIWVRLRKYFIGDGLKKEALDTHWLGISVVLF